MMIDLNWNGGIGVNERNNPEFIARYRESDGESQSLWQHLQGVSTRTGKFACKFDLEATGRLLGLIHDLGKVTVEFQQYIMRAQEIIGDATSGARSDKLDHSTAGAQVLYESFRRPDGRTTLTADILSLVVASHHGLMDSLDPGGGDRFGKRLDKGESETRKDQALSLLPQEIACQLRTLLNSDVEKELEQFLQRSFETNYSHEERHFSAGMIVRFLLSCLIDADRLDAADFEKPENEEIRQSGNYVAWNGFIRRLEKHLDDLEVKHELDLLRRDISNSCLAMAIHKPGFFRLTVPTGSGKTLASLRFALHHAAKYGLERILYIIPYTSIIDQNARSIRKALDVDFSEVDLILEHHSNLNPDKEQAKGNSDNGEEYETKYKLLTENWDSPIILTTMVQFLESFYSAGTNSCRRLHQLANSVIIFDEIQTLPITMTHLFNLATKFLVNACGSSILLCTATQPILHDVKPVARALPFAPERQITITAAQKRSTLERVEIFDYTRPLGWSQIEIAELALKENHLKKSVLVIVNTKKDATNIYSHLSQKEHISVYHLSTNMCAAHRTEELENVTRLLNEKDGQPFILVSTQLIEAGVDVDFDVVIRSLTGIDSIAQAAGRCNRHGSKPHKGRVILVNSHEENLSRLPDMAVGKEITLRILEEFRRDKTGYFQGHLLSEPALERYFEYYFYDRRSYMDYPLSQKSSVGRNDNLVNLLGYNHQSLQEYGLANKNEAPNRILMQSFQTAAKCFEVIPNIGHGIIVPHKKGKDIISDLAGVFEPKRQFKILREAQRFSVNCFSHELTQLSKAGALYEVQEGSGIFCLREGFYHEKLGWTPRKSTKMETYQP